MTPEYQKDVARESLKPCPFCASPAIVQSKQEGSGALWFVCCSNEAGCVLYLVRTKYCMTRSKAIEKWNTRPASAASGDEKWIPVESIFAIEEYDGQWFLKILGERVFSVNPSDFEEKVKVWNDVLLTNSSEIWRAFNENLEVSRELAEMVGKAELIKFDKGAVYKNHKGLNHWLAVRNLTDQIGGEENPTRFDSPLEAYKALKSSISQPLEPFKEK